MVLRGGERVLPRRNPDLDCEGVMSEGYYYIAGPMRGRAEFNFPAFRAAARTLRDAGHNVVSPHEKDEAVGFDPAGMTGHENLVDLGFDMHMALAWDTAAIATPLCKGVVCLPGWEHSSGAKAEVALAQALGKDVWDYEPDGLSLTARRVVVL